MSHEKPEGLDLLPVGDPEWDPDKVWDDEPEADEDDEPEADASADPLDPMDGDDDDG